MIRHGYIDLITLVWCLAYSWCFAARDFGLPLGASDEHTLQRSVRSEQRRGRPKELLPEGLRRKWPGASLLLSHRSLRICSFVAPRPKPFWAQRNTSYMRDTTLGLKQACVQRARAHQRIFANFGRRNLATPHRNLFRWPRIRSSGVIVRCHNCFEPF